MTSPLIKAQQALSAHRELLLEQPSPTRIKRFLIAVNGWCNSKCTFCNIWKYDKRIALEEEITLAELEQNLFGSAALQDVLDIGITGGEPFLRRDLVALCGSMFRHFKKARIGAVTNGIRYQKIVDAASQITQQNPGRQFMIAISLDGYAETHDTVRGVPGNFERILMAIKLLREQAPATLIGFSHTISPLSMHDSLRCYQLSRELGIGFMYRMAHEAPYLRNEGAPIWSSESLQTVKPVIEELNRRMLHDQSLGAKLGNTNYADISFYDHMLDYFENPRRTCECYSGTHSFLLGHDGQLHACVNLPDAMGNIRQQSFDSIWYGERANTIRMPIAAWQCHCWTNCETEFSMARQKSAFIYGMRQNAASLFQGQGSSLPSPPASLALEESRSEAEG
jgi:Fe-coproporphyrin III synthase